MVEKIQTAELAANETSKSLSVDNSILQRVIVNGMDVSEDTMEEHILAKLKGCIMKAQGIVGSYVPDYGYIKHDSSVDISYKGECMQVRVPQWNALKMSHQEWKQECANRIKGQIAKNLFLRTHLAEVMGTPDAVIKLVEATEQKKAVETTVETESTAVETESTTV